MVNSRIHFEDNICTKRELLFGVIYSSWGLTKVKQLKLKNASEISIYLFNTITKEKHLIVRFNKHYIDLELKIKESKQFPYCNLILNNKVIYSKKYCFTCILECNTNCSVNEKIEKL